MSTSDPSLKSDIVYPSAIPFILVHLACVAVFWSGVTWTALSICFVLYWVRIFAIGAGYHRYFSHRAYSTGRVFQFILAVIAQSSAQRSVLWWAAIHRHHHLHADTAEDVHSPARDGFVYSHLGWIFAKRNDRADLAKVRDLAVYPELLWLHRNELVPAPILGLLCFLIGGWSGLVVGFFWSTILVYHSTFCINSLAHLLGRKRYVTGDDSRNNWLLAFLTMGEGWHNNHHAYQSSARQGFKWWEIDPTYYILKGLCALGIIWDLKTPPKLVLQNEHRLGSSVISKTAEKLARTFDAARIAQTITSGAHYAELLAFYQALDLTPGKIISHFEGFHFPDMPNRDIVFAKAKEMFIHTASLDAIVDHAYELLLLSIGHHLAQPQ